MNEEGKRFEPSQPMLIEALQHLNEAHVILYACGLVTWNTDLMRESSFRAYENGENVNLTVGEVMTTIIARVAGAIRMKKEEVEG